MNVQVAWQGKRRFQAIGESGHPITIDAKADVGGENLGPRPMELLLMGLGGCTGIDVTMILEKMRIPYNRVEIALQGARAEQPPEKFTEITLTYHIDAPNASWEKVERAVRLSQETYCSASHSLSAKLIAVLVLNGESKMLQ